MLRSNFGGNGGKWKHFRGGADLRPGAQLLGVFGAGWGGGMTPPKFKNGMTLGQILPSVGLYVGQSS